LLWREAKPSIDVVNLTQWRNLVGQAQGNSGLKLKESG